jgi:hypothetical protein
MRPKGETGTRPSQEERWEVVDRRKVQAQLAPVKKKLTWADQYSKEEELQKIRCHLCYRQGHKAIQCRMYPGANKTADVCRRCLVGRHPTLQCKANDKFVMEQEKRINEGTMKGPGVKNVKARKKRREASLGKYTIK